MLYLAKSLFSNFIEDLFNGCLLYTSGDVYVTPCKDNTQIDLRDIMDELALRDINAPVLLRFPDTVSYTHLKFLSVRSDVCRRLLSDFTSR